MKDEIKKTLMEQLELLAKASSAEDVFVGDLKGLTDAMVSVSLTLLPYCE